MAALGPSDLQRSGLRQREARFGLPGQALHAWRLSFAHPRTERSYCLRSGSAATGTCDARPMRFSLRKTDGDARRGTLRLTHGIVETPTFMPVGTAATVKALTPDEVRSARSQILLANTYHLWLRPGTRRHRRGRRLASLHGLGPADPHRLRRLPSLQPATRRKLDDDGVTFQSHLDGSTHRFTPENRVAFQEALGVDIAMMLDVCVKLPADAQSARGVGAADDVVGAARAAAWQRGEDGGVRDRARRHRTELREHSAREIVALDLPGYAIGGLSVGESREEMYVTARASRRVLASTEAALSDGGRHGARHDRGRGLRHRHVRLRVSDALRTQWARDDANAANTTSATLRYARDYRPVDPSACYVCTTYTRAYLHHLFRSNEIWVRACSRTTTSTCSTT